MHAISKVSTNDCMNSETFYAEKYWTLSIKHFHGRQARALAGGQLVLVVASCLTQSLFALHALKGQFRTVRHAFTACDPTNKHASSAPRHGPPLEIQSRETGACACTRSCGMHSTDRQLRCIATTDNQQGHRLSKGRS